MSTTTKEKSKVIKAEVYRLGDNINADVHCSNKYMPGKTVDEVAAIAFQNVDKDFVRLFKPGSILVAGENFGINSSREFAIHVLRKRGAEAVVAKSFGRQFFRNAINNGLPVIECDTSGIETGDTVEVDLANGTVRVADKGIELQTPPLPRELQALLAAGGLIPFLKEHPDWTL